MNLHFEKIIAILAILLMPGMLSSHNLISHNNLKHKDVYATDASPKYSDSDFMYFRGSKIYFYSVANKKTVVYEEEKDEIVNYEFKPGTLTLFYSVCKDSMMVLKCIDFASNNPTPKHIVDWKLNCNDCITETYGTYSELYISQDGRYIGVQHDFSWDGYSFVRIKVYDVDSEKFVEADEPYKLFDYFIYEYQSDEEETDSENTFYEAGSRNGGEDGKDSKLNFYYGSEEKGGVCLTDKLRLSEPAEEFYVSEFSPKGDRVVIAAVLGWGDFPHGPLCIASLDGKMQAVLKGTDLSFDGGPSAGWLDDGTFLYVSNYEEGKSNYVKKVMMFPAKGKKPVKLVDAPSFIIMPKL